MAQEAIQVAERLHLAAPQFGFLFLLLEQVGEARNGRVQRRVHGLMILLALPLPRFEVDGAEPLHFLSQIDAGSVQLLLEGVHPRRFHFLAQFRAFVVRLERFADFVAVVHEIQHEGVLLVRVGAVQAREGLHGLDAGQALVHIQGVQQGLVETGLVLLGHQQHLVIPGGEALGQFRLPNALVHLHFGVGNAGGFVVFHGAGERHEGFDVIVLLLDVVVEAQFVAHGLQARTGDHHRLRPPTNLVAGERLKVFHHHPRFLVDVVRMELHIPRQSAGGLLAFHVGVFVARLEQLVVAVVGNVVSQHVQNEAFFNGLAHGVAMGGFAIAPEDLERLVLRRGGEGEETQVRLPPALRHAEEQGLHLFTGHAFLRGPLPRLLPQFLTSEHFLHGRGRLAALGAMCLVDDDGAAAGWQRAGALFAAFFRHLEQLAGHERKLLQRGDDDGNPALQRFGQLTRALVHLPHHAMLVLELIDGVLQLLVEHDAVRHHDHAVEDAGVLGVVQRSQTMRQPSDGVALAAARRMFDQGVVPHAFLPRHCNQLTHRLKLVVARKDQALRLGFAPLVVSSFLTLQVQETRQQIQQAAALQHLFPEIGGSVVAPVRVGRVAGTAIATLVEGQEAGG